MPFEVAVFIAFALIVGSAMFLLLRAERARMAKREDDLRRDASARGWTFQARREGGNYIQQWSGTTDFVSWRAEHVQLPSKKNRGNQHRARWWADTTRGPGHPILLMGVPKGKEQASFTVAQGDGLMARMAQKVAGMALDFSLDHYFGKDAGNLVDAAALKPVEGATVPGFIVRAIDPSEASRALFSGLQGAVTAAMRDPQCALADDTHRPWVLLLPRQVSLGRMTGMQTTADVVRMVRAGVAVALTQR